MARSTFSLGRIVATPAALDALANAGTSPAIYLERHAAGNFGEVPDSDAQANRRDIASGEGRVLSAYDLSERHPDMGDNPARRGGDVHHPAAPRRVLSGHRTKSTRSPPYLVAD